MDKGTVRNHCPKDTKKLRQNNKGTYSISISKEMIDSLGWKNGDSIHLIQIGNTITLCKIIGVE